TSLADKCVPPSKQLLQFQIQKDPDGRLVELAAEHGSLEHKVIDLYDRGLPWKWLIAGHRDERKIMGALIAWKKFCEDYHVEVIASELMLKFVKGRKVFACTLDKVAWITVNVKSKQTVEDGTYQRGE